MRYTGRIVGIISALIMYFYLYYLLHNKINITFNISHMGHVAGIGILGYLFGMQYDKVKCYNQQLKKEKEKLNKNFEELKRIKEEL